MNVAVITPDNVVANIIVADEEWMSRAATREAGVYFIPYTDENPAHIGYGYDPVTGVFEQPATPEPLPVQEAHDGIR